MNTRQGTNVTLFMSVGQFEGLMNRVQAFQQSRALLTAIALNLFSAVEQGATSAEVASGLKTNERATEMSIHFHDGLLNRAENFPCHAVQSQRRGYDQGDGSNHGIVDQ